MKITVNDKYDDYIPLKPDDILREVIKDDVTFRTMTVFIELLKFMRDNSDAFGSWVDSGWLGYEKVKTRKEIIDCLEELSEVLGFALCVRQDENSETDSV